MRKVFLYSLLAILGIILLSFTNTHKPGKKHIKASKQRSGDASRGYDYLVNGDYVSSGIPWEFYKVFAPNDSNNFLQRKGKASLIPPQFNFTVNEDGIEMLSPNCLNCHSDYLNGEYIVGLGNHSFDYRMDPQAAGQFMQTMITNKYGLDSKEFEAFQAFSASMKALSGHLTTEARGLNPADKLTAVLIAHRHPETLEWTDSLLLEIPDKTIPTDVPPWWLLKKKNAMFYTGIGRGDFSKFLMASSILTLRDTSQAAEIDKHFPDVLAWINDLEPPKYPEDIDYDLAVTGKSIFNKKCSGCHGTYGPDGEYPNYLVELEIIGTDPALSKAYTDSLYISFINWYNKSWFVQGENPGQLVIESGYVAPPLDGIWASAPYLHNGSVPDIASLLDSEKRPRYWKRSFDSRDYNFEKLGWQYEAFEAPEDCNCYNTDLEAYGNQGHRFGDPLSVGDRKAVIEYLKTL